MKTENTKVEGFYQQCADALHTTHEGQPFPHRKRTRWNNRTPGQGRYPGCGVVRRFGPQNILVALYAPIKVQRTFTSEDEVLTFLKSITPV